MISLISIWKLVKGCPPELEEALRNIAEKVKQNEPETLTYKVNLQAPFPLDSKFNPLEPPPKPIPLKEQTEVIFIEVYKNAEAFSNHIMGKIFNEFREENIKYFVEDPNNPGWPLTKSPILEQVSSYSSF